MRNHGLMELKLTAADYNLIHKTVDLSPEPATALRASLVDGMFLRFVMTEDVCGELLLNVMNAALAAPAGARRRELERLVRVLTEAMVTAGGEFDVDPLSLVRSATVHNRRAREDLGGFSPQQLHRLLDRDWRDQTPGLRLRADVPAELLAESPILHNARTFLLALPEDGSAATPKGNLNRAFVAAMVEAGRWREGFIEELRRYKKVINEGDVRPLHELRLVLELAGLVARRKGRFRSTRRGRALAAEARVGELLARVFTANFGSFNLAYHDRLPETPAFQDTIAFPLAVLARQPAGWLDYTPLWPRLLLPSIAEQLPVHEYLDYRYAMVTWRLVERLLDFGLVEVEVQTEGPWNIPKIARLRRTPLFDHFLAFDLD